MAVRIRSLLISRPIVVPLGSGSNLRLSPGELSDELAEVEVENSSKIERLQEQGVIAVESSAESKRGGGSPPRSRRRGGGSPPRSRGRGGRPD